MMKEFRTIKSKEMFERGRKNLAGGVGSSARSVEAGYTPYPIVMKYGKGSRIYDVDGNEYIDYLMALGPLSFGHRQKKLIEAVKKVLDTTGSMFGTSHPLEYEVAEKIVKDIPSADMVRFGNSGSEVVMAAIRLARAYTRKDKIIRFEGHYHGWTDMIHFSCHPSLSEVGDEDAPNCVPETLGMLKSIGDSLIIQPWNNFEVLEKTVRDRKDEIAAIITEPVMGNTGCIEPKKGYLEFLRKITRENDILLIFDEVITGFRFSLGGAKEYYNVIPDISTFAKALGAGFPVAAICGRKDIMELIAENKVLQAGTYNTNPLAMAAAKTVLTELEENPPYEKLFRLGEKIKRGMEKIIRGAGVSVFAQGVGPMFQIWFSDRTITNYREAIKYSKKDQYLAFYQAMLKRNVFFNPEQFEIWFISTAHTDEDIDITLEKTKGAIKEAKKYFK